MKELKTARGSRIKDMKTDLVGSTVWRPCSYGQIVRSIPSVRLLRELRAKWLSSGGEGIGLTRMISRGTTICWGQKAPRVASRKGEE